MTTTPDSRRRRFGRWAVLAGAGLACVAAAYLALRPSPYVSEVVWVPKGLAIWADRHGDIRNLVAFALVGLVAGGAGRLAGLGAYRLLLGVAVLAAGVEIAQLGIAGRVFSWVDIAWSWAGVGVAWLVLKLVSGANRSR